MKFNASQIDKYTSTAKNSYFKLSNNKDTAKVRFLYRTMDDVEGYGVYKVKVGDRERYVNSIRAYDDPIENDPFAMAGFRLQAKLFVPLCNIDTGEVQLWERPYTFVQRINSLTDRYNPLCNEIFEIERIGASGSKDTRYEIYPIDNSPFDMSSIEIPNPLGTTILDKTFQEMEYYLQNGNFPQAEQQAANRAFTEQRRTPGGRVF